MQRRAYAPSSCPARAEYIMARKHRKAAPDAADLVISARIRWAVNTARALLGRFDYNLVVTNVGGAAFPLRLAVCGLLRGRQGAAGTGTPRRSTATEVRSQAAPTAAVLPAEAMTPRVQGAGQMPAP